MIRIHGVNGISYKDSPDVLLTLSFFICNYLLHKSYPPELALLSIVSFIIIVRTSVCFTNVIQLVALALYPPPNSPKLCLSLNPVLRAFDFNRTKRLDYVTLGVLLMFLLLLLLARPQLSLLLIVALLFVRFDQVHCPSPVLSLSPLFSVKYLVALRSSR